jgi:hypothetical protein
MLVVVLSEVIRMSFVSCSGFGMSLYLEAVGLLAFCSARSDGISSMLSRMTVVMDISVFFQHRYQTRPRVAATSALNLYHRSRCGQARCRFIRSEMFRQRSVISVHSASGIIVD